jgi:hypothetical protein
MVMMKKRPASAGFLLGFLTQCLNANNVFHRSDGNGNTTPVCENSQRNFVNGEALLDVRQIL